MLQSVGYDASARGFLLEEADQNPDADKSPDTANVEDTGGDCLGVVSRQSAVPYMHRLYSLQGFSKFLCNAVLIRPPTTQKSSFHFARGLSNCGQL